MAQVSVRSQIHRKHINKVWKKPIHFNLKLAVYREPNGLCLIQCYKTNPVLVGPCNHGMAHPQVADRGKASDKEGSCE